MRIYLESLGCARNQVDSETMLTLLRGTGARVTDDPAAAEVIVVNTCSFIEAAADESIEAILSLARLKQEGRCRRLIVTGCLPERYREQLVAELPEVDLFLGTGAYDRIVAAVRGELPPGACLLPDPDAIDSHTPVARQAMAPHAAYLKIAEGCSRHCTYCIIPRLRGRLKSRPRATLLTEARTLIAAGARELTLVAQDTTAYGTDQAPPDDLAHLLEALAGVDPTVWIRFMYGHPESLAPAVLHTLAAHPNLCPYLDLPIQHASTRILRRMGRRYTDSDLLRLLESIRATVPDVALRTTVLVGFPGETDDDFDRLTGFIQKAGFDHLGVFAYSDADDLPSHHLDGHVEPAVAQERLDEVMALQQHISAQRLMRHSGRQTQVLLEEPPGEDGLWIGRTQHQAPEVDGVTFVRPPATPVPGHRPFVCGAIVPVRIVETLDYDLIAEAL
ncbi:MAG: 30S ribosomal protein S12 methylthiotransferase RimO [Desulfatitalea sp.]|nr:30S ribosomal protein S12 methylthiotransferase RimO [Desulfatitalea sp.]